MAPILYDLYGFPTQDERGGERVAVALTFGAVPATGVLNPDLLYRILVVPGSRVAHPASEDWSLQTVLDLFRGRQGQVPGAQAVRRFVSGPKATTARRSTSSTSPAARCRR